MHRLAVAHRGGANRACRHVAWEGVPKVAARVWKCSREPVYSLYGLMGSNFGRCCKTGWWQGKVKVAANGLGKLDGL